MIYLKRSAVQVIPSIICSHHIVQVICARVVILSGCLSVLLTCIRDLLLSDICIHMLNNISDSLVQLFYCRLTAYCIDFLGRKINLSGISPAIRSRSEPNSVYVDRSRVDKVQGILGAIGPFWPKWGLGRFARRPSFFCLVNHATFRQLCNGRFSPNLVTKRKFGGKAFSKIFT